MAEGWIKLYRQIKYNALWQDKPFSKGQAWIDILLEVNHTKNDCLLGNKVIKVEVGEKVTSIRKLCNKWGWSNTKVKNFLNLLQKQNMISYKSDTKKTVIKVLNYSDYQRSSNKENISKAHQKHIKNDAKAHQKHTNKNVKNDKNEKEIKHIWSFYKKTFSGVYEPRKLSDKRKGKIKQRLKTYSADEIKTALKNMRKNDYLCGSNDKSRVYAKPEYCFRNDEKIEEWLNQKQEKKTDVLDEFVL